MAYNKEAIIIVLDVSPFMCDDHLNQGSFLTEALQIIKQIVHRKIFTESKDEIAIVSFGTSKTSNPLAYEDEYQHICVERNLSVPDFDVMKWLTEFQPSDTTEADFIDALIVAMDHLQTNLESKTGFKHRHIILLSSLMCSFVDDQIDNIMSSMKKQGIVFNMISPKCIGDGNDVQSEQHKKAEEVIKQIYTMVDGHHYSFQESLSKPGIFTKHNSKATAWKCTLDIGSNISIPICGYIKLKSYKISQSWKKVYANDPATLFKESRTLHLNDENETEIDYTETVQAYYYGSTLVPVSEDGEKYKCTKCFKVLGFTAKENAPVYSYMADNTMYVTSEPNNQVISVAFSALVNALFETDLIAIVRRVYDARSGPRIGCLKPHIKNDYECMIYYELPFFEDVLNYEFDSLPVDGISAPKKFKPTDAQMEAMDNLIDTMTFSDNEEKHNLLEPKYTSNPTLERFYQCFEQRVLEPTKPIPDLPSSLTTKHGVAFFENKEAIRKIKENFKLENVKPDKTKKTGEKLFDNNLDMDSFLKASEKKGTLTSTDETSNVPPKEDFKQLLLAGKYFDGKTELLDTENAEKTGDDQSEHVTKLNDAMKETSADDLLDEM